MLLGGKYRCAPKIPVVPGYEIAAPSTPSAGRSWPFQLRTIDMA